MKLADYLIRFLADKGIDNIFEVYGAANGDLIDAFTRIPNTRYVSVMHEQAGGFAAEGYAKVSGKPGVAIATSGPGGQNFVTPIANCFYDSVPAIFITGQVKTKYQRPDNSLRQRGFQETDIVGITKPVTKNSTMIRNPNDIKYELEKAWFLCQEGRPGPVLLDFPIDIQQVEVDIDKLIGFDKKPVEIQYDLDKVDFAIDSYLKDLSSSKRPSILVGGGVRISNGIEELLQVGEKLKIPMFPTWNALDVVTSDLDFYGGRIGSYGGAGRNFAIQNSDLVLAVGSRISGRLFGSNSEDFLRGAKKYLVNIEQSILQRKLQEVPFDENILCDAKTFLTRLRSKLEQRSNFDFSNWMKHTIELRKKYDTVLPEYYSEDSNNGYVNPYVFMRTLSEEMSNNDIFIADCGGNIVVSSHAFETKQGQRFLTNNGNSPMGFSFAGAMGAYLASKPEQNVVCVIGDGGFNMNIQELQTVKNYGLSFKTFILNNHCYGITRQFQRTKFEGREEACGPKGYSPPNFVDICMAYKIDFATINKNNSDLIKEKIREVLEFDSPVVCDVDIGNWDKYEPRVFGGASIEDMYPYLSRDEFRENLAISPYKGWKNPPVPQIE